MSEENVSNTNDHHERDDHKRRPRKKRKNFLANAKKYAKKGQMGRGTKIPEELYQYFVGILDAMKQGIEDKDERTALVNNVLERTKGEEQNVIGNQLGCRVVELLLPFASPEDLERYMEVLSPDLRRLCSDNFTSHVVETLLRVACERATEHLQTGEGNSSDSDDEEASKKKKAKLEPKVEKKYTEDHIKKCYEFTIKISKYALNNLEDFVWDQYANHILRSVLKCLSGITLLPGEKPKVNIFKDSIDDGKGIPPHTGKMMYKTVTDEFKEIVKEFVHRLTSWPQFKDLPYQNITSGLVQVLLYAIKNVDKNVTKDLLRKLLDESFAPEDWVNNSADDKKEVKDGEGVAVDTSNLPPVFESEPAVRMLEAALFVSKKKTYTQIYARCFINRLGQLAAMPMLNYTVQRLVDNCQVKEEFEPMFDELSDRMGALLACGNTGVLVALAKACLRLKAKQAQYINSLEAALNCSSAEHQKYFPVLCLRLLPRARVDLAALHQDYFIHVHGSVILQAVLDFQRPAKAVSGLLELTGDQLLVILCDAKGCHVADAFCKGQFVGVKARDKLIWRLKGYYQKLVLSQYGSRAFEQVFQVASLEQKVKIMTELSDKSNLLNSTQYGRLVANKLDVETFKLSQKKWEETWKKKEIQNK
ncbi:nucleolar protein 9 [Spodoptera frugiperda]|uniref:Nucleolar protein 9 n=1 Tax=Spodoptera frugiperda TaxID=7108 RepID=A0A9R0ERY4_SPOFR|nr:nucleolar protein 9 [Spodoptera frugiperda]